MNILPCSFFPLTFVAEHNVMWYGTSLRSAEIGCPGFVPSQLLAFPQPARWWGSVETEMALALRKHSSATAETSLCY